MMDLQNESPRTKNGTRTFFKECVVTTEGGTEIAVVAMSIITLHSFQEEHIEALLSEFAQTSRAFYLEAGNTLRTEL